MSTPELPKLSLPSDVNYIGVFLTFGCNLNCSYCINDPGQAGGRDAMGRTEMAPELWVRALNRLRLPPDLPITLQGGEPTLYGRGLGIGGLLANVDASFDLLTNLALPPGRMKRCLDGQVDKLRRDAPYPSIRVSYHPPEMDRVWGRGIDTLLDRCEALRDLGFRVGPDKRSSDVGIYMVAHPGNLGACEDAARAAAKRVAFETKEFLGLHEGVLHGTYKYPFSIDLVAGGHWPTGLSCQCRTTELLIDPLGFVWPCHHFLYETWMNGGSGEAFDRLSARDFAVDEESLAGLALRPVGHILDPAFTLAALRDWHPCDRYGRCIGCDTKVKNNRFQSLEDAGLAHTSVEIRDIVFPESVLERIPAERSERLRSYGIIAAHTLNA